MNSILQPVDNELTRLYQRTNSDSDFIHSLQGQLAEVNKPSVFKPERYDNLHKGIFIQQGNTGNTGGGSDKPHGTFKVTSGDPTVVTINPAGPYDEYYWNSNPVPAFNKNWSRFEWGAEWSFPTQKDLDASMALEWEIELCLNGTVWNMGWQILLQFDGRDTDGFRLFDYNKSTWIKQPIDFSKDLLSPGKILKVSSEYVIIGNTETHMALNVNGKRWFVGWSQTNTLNRWPKDANYLHWSFQLDTDGHGTSYTANLGNGYMNVL